MTPPPEVVLLVNGSTGEEWTPLEECTFGRQSASGAKLGRASAFPAGEQMLGWEEL